MIYVFDLDGTLCTKVDDGDYSKATPYPIRIQRVNYLYDEGHTVKIFTARGMGRHDDNANAAYEELYEMTESQLSSWGVKYHNLFLGKPSGNLYIDDKGMRDYEFFD